MFKLQMINRYALLTLLAAGALLSWMQMQEDPSTLSQTATPEPGTVIPDSLIQVSVSPLTGDDAPKVVKAGRPVITKLPKAGDQGQPKATIFNQNGKILNGAFGFLQDRLGNLWICTSTGLNKYDGHSFTSFTAENGLVDNTIRDIAEDQAGNIWLATRSGLFQFAGRRFTP